MQALKASVEPRAATASEAAGAANGDKSAEASTSAAQPAKSTSSEEETSLEWLLSTGDPQSLSLLRMDPTDSTVSPNTLQKVETPTHVYLWGGSAETRCPP